MVHEEDLRDNLKCYHVGPEDMAVLSPPAKISERGLLGGFSHRTSKLT